MVSREQTTGVIFNVMRYALHDGPGIRTTVFLKGCPLACWWCHNPEGRSFRPQPVYYADRCRHCGQCLSGCPEQAIEESGGVMRSGVRCRSCGTCVEICRAGAREIAGRTVTVGEVVAEIERDMVFYDESGGGVTLSGGEPAAQPRFAGAILDACRERRIHTAIETCGFAPRETLLELCARAHLVLFDLKMVDAAKHEQYTGVPNQAILDNLVAVRELSGGLLVRIPIIPGVNDSSRDIEEFVQFVSGARIHRVDLLPYHGSGAVKYRRLGVPYSLDYLKPALNGEAAPFLDAFAKAGIDVRIGG